VYNYPTKDVESIKTFKNGRKDLRCVKIIVKMFFFRESAVISKALHSELELECLITELFQNSPKQKVWKIPSFAGP
jgi:hypothetical protein